MLNKFCIIELRVFILEGKVTIIDLHMHTTKSDGSLTPTELIDEAVKNNVKYISITDHDTLGAYSDELFSYAKEKGIHIITGVEISTKLFDKAFHVLAYNVDYRDTELNELLAKIRRARSKYLLDVEKKLSELGYVLNIEKLKKVESVTKANIALDIIENKLNEKKLIDTFGYIPSRGVFIESIMNEGCPAFVKKDSISPREASIAIKKAGGKVVLAHPVVYDRKDKLPLESIEEVIQSMEIDGIEANYIYYDKNLNRYDDIEKWCEFAQKKGLFVTVGSDFHLDDGVKVKIGFVNQDFELKEDIVKEILNNLGIK